MEFITSYSFPISRLLHYDTVKPVCVDHLFSIQIRPAYTGGQIMETTWRYEKWIVHYNLCKIKGLGYKDRNRVEQTTDSSAS